MTRLSMTMGAFADFAISTAAKSAKAPIDRKSTRLNSSHLGIAYSLFCLKKKQREGTHAHQNQSVAIAHARPRGGRGARARDTRAHAGELGADREQRARAGGVYRARPCRA